MRNSLSVTFFLYKIYNGIDPYEHHQMSAEKSNVIQQKFKLGERPYTDLRQFLLPYVEISPAYKTKKFRMQYEPEIKKCHMDGVWAPLRGISYQLDNQLCIKG